MDPNRPQRQQTSPWVYIGCGCGLIVILIVAGVAALTFFGYRKGKEFEESFKDPQKRAAKTREILPYDQLPAGYYPLGGLSIPMVMEMAMFSDHEPAPGEGKDGARDFKERGFIYMNFRNWKGKKGELRDYLEGKGKKPDWMNRSDTDLEDRDILGRGHLQVNGQDMLYVATRNDEEHAGGRHRNGLVTFLTLDCPGDNRQRLGLLFGPDPGPGEPADTLKLAGTNADPHVIQEFVDHFRFCG
jgi:hypothetical protein